MNQQILDALTFYADPKSYCTGHNGPDVMRDLGVKAKEALDAAHETTPVTTGARIKAMREAQRFTLSTFADAIGLSRSYLWEVEKGRAEIGSTKLGRIADVLMTSTDYLLGRSPDSTAKEQP